MKYRKALIEDIPTLIELRKRQLADEGQNTDTFIDDELANFLTKRFDDDTLVEFVAEESGEIIGTAAILFMEFPPEFNNATGIVAYVTNMYTAPEYRGRGIATDMLQKLTDEAKMRGVSTMLLAASPMGATVYRKFGFKNDSDEWMKLKLSNN